MRIVNVTESTSPSDGALHIIGGAGIEKNLNVGGAVGVTGELRVSSGVSLKAATSGRATIAAPDTVSDYTFTLPEALPTTAGYALVSDLDGKLSFAPAAGSGGSEEKTLTFAAANDVTTPTAVTGFTVTDTSFVCHVTVSIVASVIEDSSTSLYEIQGTLQPDGLYDLSVSESAPTKQGVEFSVSPAGQMLYTAPDISGWVSTTMKIEKLSSSGNGDPAQVLAITNVTPSNSVETGALTVEGGVGIKGDLHAGNVFIDTSAVATESYVTSRGYLTDEVADSMYEHPITLGLGLVRTGNEISLGAAQTGITSVGALTGLTVQGGVAASGDVRAANLFAGGKPVATQDYVSGLSYLSAGTGLTMAGNTLSVDATTVATRSYVDSQDFLTASGAASTYQPIITTTPGLTKTGNSLSIDASQTGITSLGTLTGLTSSGDILVSSTTEASSASSSGALQITGGAAVAKNLYVGGSIVATGDFTGSGEVYCGMDKFFNVNGNGAFYFQVWGGGWTMTDPIWLRSYNGKSIYTSGWYNTRGGSDGGGTMATGGVSFEYAGGGYKHFISSRHDGNSAGGNMLEFYLQNSSATDASSAPGTGNVLALTLSPTSATVPGDLAVNGTAYLNGTTRFLTSRWHISSDNAFRFHYAQDGRTYYGSKNGYEWHDANDSAILFLDDNGTLSTTNRIVGSRLDFGVDGDGINWGTGPYSRIYTDSNLHLWTGGTMQFDFGGTGNFTGGSTGATNVLLMNSSSATFNVPVTVPDLTVSGTISHAGFAQFYLANDPPTWNLDQVLPISWTTIGTVSSKVYVVTTDTTKVKLVDQGAYMVHVAMHINSSNQQGPIIMTFTDGRGYTDSKSHSNTWSLDEDIDFKFFYVQTLTGGDIWLELSNFTKGTSLSFHETTSRLFIFKVG
jgi:hypothetical protein